MNGMIERAHRKLKTSLKAYSSSIWAVVLPFIVLLWNNSTLNNQPFTPSQLVFGQHQRLPGDILIQNPILHPPPEQFANALKEKVKQFVLIVPTRHPNNAAEALLGYSSLDRVQMVFVTEEAKENKLSKEFRGPFKIIKRFADIFTLDCAGQEKQVHIS